jgi:hypothetical protein
MLRPGTSLARVRVHTFVCFCTCKCVHECVRACVRACVYVLRSGGCADGDRSMPRVAFG